MELLIRNGLVKRVEGDVPMYKTMPKGVDALWHFRELEALIPELKAMSEDESVLS